MKLLLLNIKQIEIKIKPNTKIRTADAVNLLSYSPFKNGFDKATIDGFSNVVKNMTGRAPFKQKNANIIISLFEQCARTIEEFNPKFKTYADLVNGKITKEQFFNAVGFAGFTTKEKLVVPKFIPKMNKEATLEFVEKYNQRFN